jgi:hypothetical protein
MFLVLHRVLKPSKETVDDEDEDVARERKRVISGNAKDDVLRLEELSKVSYYSELCIEYLVL